MNEDNGAVFGFFGLRNPTRRLLCLKGHLATLFGMTKVLCTRFAGHDQKSPQYHHPQAPQVSEKVCVCVFVCQKKKVSVSDSAGAASAAACSEGGTHHWWFPHPAAPKPSLLFPPSV